MAHGQQTGQGLPAREGTIAGEGEIENRENTVREAGTQREVEGGKWGGGDNNCLE